MARVLGLGTGRRRTARELSYQWLEGALFADSPTSLVAGKIGQFDPGGAATGLINPWDYVLTLEGALVFAAAAARRLEAGTGRASFPFSVGSSPVGYPSSVAKEGSKGELWAPLWRQPASVGELARLMGEGRADWRGRQAASGLDMARAAVTLGVDRGIFGFVRHAFVERHGQMTLAVPVGRMRVAQKPEVLLLQPVDSWLERARRGRDIPAAVERAVRAVDASMFELARADHGRRARRLQDVLVALAACEVAVSRSSGHRERSKVGPVRRLPAAEWLPDLNDGTVELRLAAAAASGRDDDGSCLRWLVRSIGSDGRGGLKWSDRAPLVHGLGLRPLADVLAEAHVRRMIERMALARGASGGAGKDSVGVQTAYRWRLACHLDDLAAFGAGDVDEDRLAQLLGGLLLLDFDHASDGDAPWSGLEDADAVVSDPALGVLAPFFHGRTLRLRGLELDLLPEPSWPAALAAGRVGDVVERALLRLRMAKLTPPSRRVPSGAAAAGVRLAAALLFPVTGRPLRRLLDRVDPSLPD